MAHISMNGLGKSGDKLELLDYKVVKTSQKPRLLLQAWKQQEFQHPTIKAPKILKLTSKIPYIMEMERIYAHSLIEAFSYMDVGQVKNCIAEILGYIDDNLKCETASVDRSMLEVKAGEYVNLLRQFTPKFLTVPIGKCHGDLTLSNILWNKNLFFIDFLDSFVESPLADIAKLRQDTFHQWNPFLLNLRGKPRMKVILDYFDNEIVARYKHLPIIPFQFLTLVRVLPYANDIEKQFIKEELRKYENVNSPYVR